MQITKTDKKPIEVPVSDLCKGDLFEFNDCTYMKLGNDTNFNCLRLANSEHYTIRSDFKVKKLLGKLTVWEA